MSVPLTLFASGLTDYLCISLPLFYATICSVAIVTPFIEEFSKVYPLFYRHCETEKSIVTLGFMTGLGFGLTEFLLYIFTLDASIQVRLPLLFFHATNTGIASYGIAKKHQLTFYLISVALHFINNFFAILDNALWIIGGPLAITLSYLSFWLLYRKTSEKFI